MIASRTMPLTRQQRRAAARHARPAARRAPLIGLSVSAQDVYGLALPKGQSAMAYMIEGQVEVVLRHAQRLLLNLPSAAHERLLLGIEQWSSTHTLQHGCSRKIVAAHEAAHFGFYRAVGMVPHSATIEKSEIRLNKWCGMAIAAVSPIYNSTVLNICAFHPDFIIAEGAAMLAGPMAEHARGGNIYDNVGEMIAAVLYSYIHAGIVRCDISASILYLISFTNLVLNRNKSVMDAMAEKLAREFIIRADDPEIAELLNQVRAPSLKLDSGQAEEVRELIDLFDKAPVDIFALLESMFA